jgi:Leucine-rich repeat (LRR) protein
MAVVSGSGLSKGTLVDALGLERQTIADYNGSFQIRVPAGWCRLSLQRSDSVHSSLDTLIYLQPGQHTIVNPLPQFSVCNSLQCELTAVRSILDFCGLQTVVPESVCVVADSHVVELHLRARLIRTLPETIGTLYLLRILDIGQNMLDSIPGSIGRFSHLQSLLADHNSLQIIPASIGMLDSLQLLDLSYNLLQTLPEPITYLRPIVMLRLGGNMLCNIGALTAQWADRYDNYWRSLQNCH